ncbi:MAG: DUF2892 domain-containing protein [Chloroflexota bacterium]
MRARPAGSASLPLDRAQPAAGRGGEGGGGHLDLLVEPPVELASTYRAPNTPKQEGTSASRASSAAGCSRSPASALGFTSGGFATWAWFGAALLGLDFVATGIRGYCPLYARLGIGSERP